MTDHSVTETKVQRQAIDPIDLLERAADAGEDVLEACIGYGITVREEGDNVRWRLGDLARLVDKRYGSNRIGEFAKGVGAEVGRVKEYRTVAAFWTKEVRADFSDTSLTYSHFRQAMRCGDVAAARAFLYEAANAGWTVEAARVALNKRLGRPAPAVRLLDAAATVDGWQMDGTLAFCLERGVDLATLEQLTRGRRVRVVVYEVSE